MKESAEQNLQAKNLPLDVAIECLTLRESRRDIDVVKDPVEEELHKEAQHFYYCLCNRLPCNIVQGRSGGSSWIRHPAFFSLFDLWSNNLTPIYLRFTARLKGPLELQASIQCFK